MIREIRERLVFIQSNIGANAVENIPANIQRFELPIFWNVLSGITVRRVDPPLAYATARFRVTLLVDEVNMSFRISNENLAYDLADKFLTAIAFNRTLAKDGIGLNNIETVRISSEGLQAPLQYPSGNDLKQYYGIIFNIEVDYGYYC
jgi:hypothetical protein